MVSLEDLVDYKFIYAYIFFQAYSVQNAIISFIMAQAVFKVKHRYSLREESEDTPYVTYSSNSYIRETKSFE